MVRTRLDVLCWPWSSCKACLSPIPFPGKQRSPGTSGRKGRAQEAAVATVATVATVARSLYPSMVWDPCRCTTMQRRSDGRAQGHMVRGRKLCKKAEDGPGCQALWVLGEWEDRDRSPAWREEPRQLGGVRCGDRRDCSGQNCGSWWSWQTGGGREKAAGLPASPSACLKSRPLDARVESGGGGKCGSICQQSMKNHALSLLSKGPHLEDPLPPKTRTTGMPPTGLG